MLLSVTIVVAPLLVAIVIAMQRCRLWQLWQLHNAITCNDCSSTNAIVFVSCDRHQLYIEGINSQRLHNRMHKHSHTLQRPWRLPIGACAQSHGRQCSIKDALRRRSTDEEHGDRAQQLARLPIDYVTTTTPSRVAAIARVAGIKVFL